MGNILGNDSGRQPRSFEPYGKEDLKADLSVARARLEKVRKKAQTIEQIKDTQELESIINDIDTKNMFAVIDGTTYEGPDEIKQLMENLFEELRIMLANQEINELVKEGKSDFDLRWDIKKMKIPTSRIENPAVKEMMEREDENERREYLDYRSQVGGF